MNEPENILDRLDPGCAFSVLANDLLDLDAARRATILKGLERLADDDWRSPVSLELGPDRRTHDFVLDVKELDDKGFVRTVRSMLKHIKDEDTYSYRRKQFKQAWRRIAQDTPTTRKLESMRTAISGLCLANNRLPLKGQMLADRAAHRAVTRYQQAVYDGYQQAVSEGEGTPIPDLLTFIFEELTVAFAEAADAKRQDTGGGPAEPEGEIVRALGWLFDKAVSRNPLLDEGETITGADRVAFIRAHIPFEMADKTVDYHLRKDPHVDPAIDAAAEESFTVAVVSHMPAKPRHS